MKKYYKVVRLIDDSLCSLHACSTLTAKYKIGQPTFADKSRPLFIFDSFAHAQEACASLFACFITECYAKLTECPIIFHPNHLPLGTLFATEVTIKRIIPSKLHIYKVLDQDMKSPIMKHVPIQYKMGWNYPNIQNSEIFCYSDIYRTLCNIQNSERLFVGYANKTFKRNVRLDTLASTDVIQNFWNKKKNKKSIKDAYKCGINSGIVTCPALYLSGEININNLKKAIQ